jgi:hypothetical protein
LGVCGTLSQPGSQNGILGETLPEALGKNSSESEAMKLLVPAFLTVLLTGSCFIQAASWAPLKNKPPLSITWPELLLTDGTVMVLSSSDYQTWLRLTPDAQGNYANGTWTILGPMITPRLDFASQVLPSGKVWILGGEYSGHGIPQNEGYFAEIYDPTANTWAPAAPFPSITGCGARDFGGTVTSGSPVVANIISTAGWQPGWVVTRTGGPAVPAGATIVSVDSSTQVHLSANAPASGGFSFTLNPQINGNTTSGSLQDSSEFLGKLFLRNALQAKPSMT